MGMGGSWNAKSHSQSSLMTTETDKLPKEITHLAVLPAIALVSCIAVFSVRQIVQFPFASFIALDDTLF